MKALFKKKKKSKVEQKLKYCLEEGKGIQLKQTFISTLLLDCDWNNKLNFENKP